MVPHRSTNWAILCLTLLIGREAVLSQFYGRGCTCSLRGGHYLPHTPATPPLTTLVVLIVASEQHVWIHSARRQQVPSALRPAPSLNPSGAAQMYMYWKQ